jgi:hypothetical protein
MLACASRAAPWWYHGERGEQRVTGVELLTLAGSMELGAIGVRLVGMCDFGSRDDGQPAAAKPEVVQLTVRTEE